MKTKSYIIQASDTLNSIAAAHDISLERLIQLNPQMALRNPDFPAFATRSEIQVPDTRGIFQTMVDYVAERLRDHGKGGIVMLPLADGSSLVYLPPSAGMDDVLALALEVEARRQPVKV